VVSSHIAGLTKRFGYFVAPKYHAPRQRAGNKFLSSNYSFKVSKLVIAGKMLIPNIQDSVTIDLATALKTKCK